MNKQALIAGILTGLGSVPMLYSAEAEKRNLGASSTGYITVNLEITEDVTAGFLRTNLDDPDSDFTELLSTELVQSITNDVNATLPFCVMSSGGGYFEVTFFEAPENAGINADDRVDTQFSNTPPVDISFGEDELSSIKYQSIVGECNPATAIPVTINLNGQSTGEDAGKIYGQFNLLVKSE